MIDDCRNDAALTLRTLRHAPHANYVLAIAESIEQAIPLIQREPCDVILLDLGLPGYQGLEALDEIHKARLSHPIVVLSGNENETLARHALQRGAQDYIVKGDASPEVVGRAIRYAIERHAVEEASALANQSRGEFLKQLSHEVRIPMTSIQGFADLLSETSDPDRRRAAQTIKKSGEALMEMLEELLEVARIDGERNGLRCELYDLRDSLPGLCKEVQQLADQRDVLLHFDIAATLPGHVGLDSQRWERLFHSLVSAAINACSTGVLTVRVEPLCEFEPSLRVLVAEAGEVSCRTVQLEDDFTINSTTFELTRRLAEAMQGSFTANRQSLSTYSVVIPVKDASEMKRTPAPQPASPAEQQPAAVDLNNCRVLVVEDAVDNQRLLKLILQSFGTEVEVVENGQLAVDRLLHQGDFADADARGFDVVLMDMQMPVMDGYEATQVLRKRGYTRPIVAVTAHVLERERQKCFTAGCDDYLSKPVNPNMLKEKVTAHYAAGMVAV